MGGVSGERYDVQRARIFERARRRGVPESVARLFSVVQEPRCDDEPSTLTFDVVVKQEDTRLRQRINDPSAEPGAPLDAGGLGGLLETEATTSARRLLEAAQADGLIRVAELLRSALERCMNIPQQRTGAPAAASLPKAERVVDPRTGRPIGMWR
jgi:hypothetical protein